jgi:hypothetical protein
MLISEITSSEEQLNLLKLISNCTWSAIQQQNADRTNQVKKVKPKNVKTSSIKISAPPPPPPPKKQNQGLDLSSQQQMAQVKKMFDKLKPKEVSSSSPKVPSQ